MKKPMIVGSMVAALLLGGLAHEANAFVQCSNTGFAVPLNVTVGPLTCAENSAVKGTWRSTSSPKRVFSTLTAGANSRTIALGLDSGGTLTGVNCKAVDTSIGGEVGSTLGACDGSAHPLAQLFYELQRP
jgi:hypothetical protein